MGLSTAIRELAGVSGEYVKASWFSSWLGVSGLSMQRQIRPSRDGLPGGEWSPWTSGHTYTPD